MEGHEERESEYYRRWELDGKLWQGQDLRALRLHPISNGKLGERATAPSVVPRPGLGRGKWMTPEIDRGVLPRNMSRTGMSALSSKLRAARRPRIFNGYMISSWIKLVVVMVARQQSISEQLDVLGMLGVGLDLHKCRYPRTRRSDKHICT